MGVKHFGTAAFDQWELAYDTLERRETLADEVALSPATSDPFTAFEGAVAFKILAMQKPQLPRRCARRTYGRTRAGKARRRGTS